MKYTLSPDKSAEEISLRMHEDSPERRNIPKMTKGRMPTMTDVSNEGDSIPSARLRKTEETCSNCDAPVR